MTVSYECTADVSELTAEELDTLTTRLSKEHYEWAYTGSTLEIGGECEVDSYSTSADDVASEIEWILWDAAEVDADAKAKQVEFEPDWDRMPGGVDYGYWN